MKEYEIFLIWQKLKESTERQSILESKIQYFIEQLNAINELNESFDDPLITSVNTTNTLYGLKSLPYEQIWEYHDHQAPRYNDCLRV